jgi:amino acid permease
MQEKPTYASRDANWESDFKFFNTPNFAEAMSAIGTVIFTYAGTPGFFNIISEMRNPKDYRKSLAVCQITVTIFYIAVATVVYYYCGSSVASPALGSAGPLVKRVAYGLALPGLLITIVVFVHVSIFCFKVFKKSFNTNSSCRPNTFSFVPFEARSISRRILAYTGQSGWHLPLA